ncbi:MAG: GNAT family N-acetyltransferase [Pseudomonadota bacterium]
MFPSTMLDDMTRSFLEDEGAEDLWLTCDVDGQAVALAYAIPEPMTVGTWNLLALAVLPERQGDGVGTALVTHLEVLLIEGGHRILLVETSGVPTFERTRDFYRRRGFVETACIPDFYAQNDDKIVFWKALLN